MMLLESRKYFSYSYNGKRFQWSDLILRIKEGRVSRHLFALMFNIIIQKEIHYKTNFCTHSDRILPQIQGQAIILSKRQTLTQFSLIS